MPTQPSVNPFALHRIALDKVWVASNYEVPLLEPSVQLIEDLYTGAVKRLIIQVKGYVLGETAQVESVVTYPSWWDHFKADHFPRWAQDRWPPRRVTHVFTTKATYPDFRPAIPPSESRTVFIVQRVDGVDHS